MNDTPTGAPEDAPAASPTLAETDAAESPPAVAIARPSPEEAARENARGGRWAMTDYLDGWVLLGADGRPVMRNDRSRVGFFFHDVKRLAWELAAEAERVALPENASEADRRAASWRKHRRALAPLDSGFNDDWDPQVRKSYFATVTKAARLLAYDYVRTTEPEEAVRRAVSDVLNNPTYVNGPRTRLWVPGKYDAEMVKSVADTLFSEAVGPEDGVSGADRVDEGTDESNGIPHETLEAFDNEVDPNRGDSVEGDPITDIGLPGSPQLTNTQMVNGNGQPIIDSPSQAGDGLEPDINKSSDPSRLNSQSAGSTVSDGSSLAARLLPPLANYGRAAVDQTATIVSGKFEIDKLLAPIVALRDVASTALNDPALGPAIEAYALVKGGVKTSKINRAQHDKDRLAYWKLEAKNNPEKYTPENLERMKVGKAEIGPDGHPKELHHTNQTNEGGREVMTRTDHRLGPNYRKNHPQREK